MELSMWASCRSGILELALGTLLIGLISWQTWQEATYVSTIACERSTSVVRGR